MNISFLKNYKLLFLLLTLFILSNLGNILSTIQDPNINLNPKIDDVENEIPYIDSGCKFTKSETLILINRMNDKFNGNIKVNFYEHPTNFFCQGKPVYSNSNYKKIVNNELTEIYIGIGSNTDLDMFVKTGRMLLFFVFVSLIFSKFKFVNNNQTLKKESLVFCFFIFSTYSSIVYISILNAFSNFLIAILLGNYLFFSITKFFTHEVIFKSLVTLSIFPLLFYNSNSSFYWLTILYILNQKYINKIKLSKYFYISNLVFFISLIFNIKDYFFVKPNNLFDWILFSNGRHKAGIVNIEDGFQTLAYIFDILIILFIFNILLGLHKNNKRYVKIFFDSILTGFILWVIFFLLSQTHSLLNYFILTLLGLPESIDTVQSVHPDGINWRGLTPSHELTGFWLFLVSSIASFLYIETKKLSYIIVLAASLVCLSLNSQRTALILFFLSCIYFITRQIKVNFKQTSVVVFVLIIVFSIFQDGFTRLQTRIQNLDYDFQVSELQISQLNLSYERIEKYGLNYLNIPDNKLQNYENLGEFYSDKLNTNNKFIIKTFSFASHTFGREVQWIRFLNFNDISKNEIIYGKGPGQSYELLDLLIQKPHSLYLTTFYQYGFLGILLLIVLILRLTKVFIFSQFHFLHFLNLTFFINAIKNEFIFTHNQFVIFTIFILSSMYYQNNKNEY